MKGVLTLQDRGRACGRGKKRAGHLTGLNSLTPCPLLTWSLLLEQEMAEKVEEDEVKEEEDGL